MRIKKYRYLACDFETTVFDEQDSTEVWAAASVELGGEDVQIFHSLEDQFKYFISLNTNIIAYYHNLKFDGNFWLSYFLNNKKMKPACNYYGSGLSDFKFKKDKEMKNNEYKFSISSMGQWYSIIIKVKNHFIEIRDSLKLLPFSLKQLGESFKTKHRKLTMEYKGYRFAGCDITDKEKEYLANDVLVLKEALEIMFNDGHKSLTIGSCCLTEFKNSIGKKYYDQLFPNMYMFLINPLLYDVENADEYIRKSYKGGFCYVVEGKKEKIYKNGLTFDVNSLYPSVMHSVSVNRYPIGKPTFWKGDCIPEAALDEHKYFFVRIKTRFYIKKDKIPFIQIKGDFRYKATECLKTSDLYDKKTGEYYSHYIDFDGTEKLNRVELTLTQTDFELFIEHYDAKDFEILDGCYFSSRKGIFDEYINKYAEIKKKSKGAIRQIAKLFLNNLYGKLAASTRNNFKGCYLKDDGSIGFYNCDSDDKTPGYIPCGSAITSYARNFTIRAAQKNYYGENKPGFIYADTDSIHLDLPVEKVKGIEIDPVEFCKWKCETSWDFGFFTRQKTYIEHVIQEDFNAVEPYYNIKCAGMPKNCKQLFNLSLQGYIYDEYNKLDEKFIKEKDYILSLTDEQREFLKEKHTIKDFKKGFKVPGKLRPKVIKGGVILVDCPYEMR